MEFLEAVRAMATVACSLYCIVVYIVDLYS